MLGTSRRIPKNTAQVITNDNNKYSDDCVNDTRNIKIASTNVNNNDEEVMLMMMGNNKL